MGREDCLAVNSSIQAYAKDYS